MTESTTGGNPSLERPQSPEDFASVAEIIGWTDDLRARYYPGITPLTASQVKFTPSLVDVIQREYEDTYHPFFKGQVDENLAFADPKIESWGNANDKNVWFSSRALDKLREDKAVGYWGIGMDLINCGLLFDAQAVTVESEKATKMAQTIVEGSYRKSLAGNVPPDSYKEALSYMREKGSAIRVRGMLFEIVVEDKIFLPPTGFLTNKLLLDYFAMPLKAEFVEIFGKEFGFNDGQIAAAQEGLFQALDTRSIRDVVNMFEEDGIVGRMDLLTAYRNGDLGKIAISTRS